VVMVMLVVVVVILMPVFVRMRMVMLVRMRGDVFFIFWLQNCFHSFAPLRQLPQVGFQNINHFFGGVGLFRFRFVGGVQNMKPNMAFEHVGNQTVQRTPAGNHDVKGFGTVRFLFEKFFQSVKLPAKAVDAQQEFLFVLDSVCHNEFRSSVRQTNSHRIGGMVWRVNGFFTFAPARRN